MRYDLKQITLMKANLMSANLGDEIISVYCDEHLREVFPLSLINTIPTQMKLDKRAKMVLNRSELAVVCGTNLIASNMRKRKQWNINLLAPGLHQKFILCGVGWWQYQEDCDLYTKMLLHTRLSDQYTHSVRDEYTRKKLASAGISNVLNTGCPTMWKLTEEHCKMIPTQKADRVIFTLTDYMKDPEKDRMLIEILRKHYNEIYMWIQNDTDYSYVKSIADIHGVKMVPPSLSEYDKVLKSGDIDYVGTRLHGGIRALNHGVRSIIIGVDNRAREISNDTGLPVFIRSDVGDRLCQRINDTWETTITIPQGNINKWKAQFTD